MARFRRAATTLLLVLSAGDGLAVMPQLATSDSHTLALKADGTLWGWGYNTQGLIGDGTTQTRLAPVYIGSGFISITSGRLSSYAVKSDGSLWAWGANEVGPLGDGTKVDRLRPVQIGQDFMAVAANWSNAIGLKRDGSLWSWGGNVFGSLGNGRLEAHVVSTPQRIGEGFVALNTSMSHSLALRADGSLWSWGINDGGQLGTGDFEPRAVPTRVGEGFVAVSASESFSLAIKRDGSLWSWGWNSWAQLGLGITGTSLDPDPIELSEFRPRPEKVNGQDYVAVTNGSYHAHALKADGSLWGWGSGMWGALGDGLGSDGSANIVPLPKKIGDGYWKTTNGGGNNNGFAIRFDGSVWAWGTNAGGMLGDGTGVDRSVPTPIGFNVFPASGVVADAMAFGPLQRRTLRASVAPNQVDAGNMGCVFVLAVLPDASVLSLTASGWQTHWAQSPRALRCGPLVAHEAVLLQDADAQALRGTVVYLGYGLGADAPASLADMLNRQLSSLAYVMQ